MLWRIHLRKESRIALQVVHPYEPCAVIEVCELGWTQENEAGSCRYFIRFSLGWRLSTGCTNWGIQRELWNNMALNFTCWEEKLNLKLSTCVRSIYQVELTMFYHVCGYFRASVDRV